MNLRKECDSRQEFVRLHLCSPTFHNSLVLEIFTACKLLVNYARNAAVAKNLLDYTFVHTLSIKV